MRAPRLARLLASLATHPDDRRFVVQDLDDAFFELADRIGAAAARRWYWSQVLRGLAWRVRPDGVLLRRRTWEGSLGDVRMGVRGLRRRPLYAAGVMGTLALGLGAAALVTAVAWRVWLAPMPFPDPDRVVRLYETEPAGDAASAQVQPGRKWRISPPLLEDLRANPWSTIQTVAGFSPDEFDWVEAGQVRRLSVLKVSPGGLSMLGVVPLAGRLLGDEGRAEVVLTEGFWIREFGGDPGVVGSTSMELDGDQHPVVGVVRLPAGYPQNADVVRTLVFHESQLTQGMRGARYLDVAARVSPGRSVEEASAEVAAFVQALGQSEPQHRGWGAQAVRLADDLVAPYKGILALLLVAGLTFLLLAVVNVGGLVAARRAEAREDRAVRLALGASEYRLLRGAVVESGLLGVAGAALGVALAHWLLTPIRAMVPHDVPRLGDVAIGVGLTAGVVGAGVAFGALVGVIGYAMSRGAGLSARGRRSTTTPGLRGRQYLVAGQVALTTLLTTGGVAILTHVSALRAIDVGFNAEGVTDSRLLLSEVRYPDRESRLSVWRSLEEGLRARGIPVAVAVNTPMSGMNAPYGFRVDDASEQAFAQYHSVGDDYFDVMGIEVREGRVFGPDDHESSMPVLIVSDALAREHFPGVGALGREIRVLDTRRTIVGVVGSTRHFGPDAEIQPEMYVPMEQDPWHLGTVLMRTDRDDAAAVLAAVAREVDPWLALPPAEPYARHLQAWYAPLRLQLVMVGGLGLLGLSLASLGLYALVAYHVSTRRREIGIRMALGAPVRQVFRGVVGQGMWLALLGGGVGLAAWYALMPLARGLVDGIDPESVAVPLLVTIVIGGACMLATLVPAWRSMSVDPAATLKAE